MESHSNKTLLFIFSSCGKQNLDLPPNLVRSFFCVFSPLIMYLWGFNSSLCPFQSHKQNNVFAVPWKCETPLKTISSLSWGLHTAFYISFFISKTLSSIQTRRSSSVTRGFLKYSLLDSKSPLS